MHNWPLLLLAVLNWSCGVDRGHSAGDFATGRELFESNCGGCHLLPRPDDLPFAVWDTIVLPRMRVFMAEAGLTVTDQDRDADWLAIRDYILDLAPDTLAVSRPVGAVATSDLFRPRFTSAYLSPPSVTFVDIPPGGGILAADINQSALYYFDGDLEVRRRWVVGKGITDAALVGDALYATVIGSFTPTDAGVGQLIRIRDGRTDTLADGLLRPTSLMQTQLDGDPEPEWVVSEYGQWSGRLSYYDRRDDGRYQAAALTRSPGAIRVSVETDSTFLVLYGQGDERIERHTQGRDGPRVRTVLRFPPSYGSSSMAVIDWNGDAHPDLLYTNGDNADYASLVKPYHGIRVYRGRADGSFTEALVLPLPGAYEAAVADFTGDGQLDIAAISFFPDFRDARPASAVLYRNEEGRWTADRLPRSDRGRWLRLAAGDIDGDGDQDLVAGSLSMETGLQRGNLESWVRGGLPFIVWENQSTPGRK